MHTYSGSDWKKTVMNIREVALTHTHPLIILTESRGSKAQPVRGPSGGSIMVHFLKQLVGSIYRPSYWYQLILHRAAYCLPAGTVALVRGGSECNRRGPEATLMTNVWGRFFFYPGVQTARKKLPHWTFTNHPALDATKMSQPANPPITGIITFPR